MAIPESVEDKLDADPSWAIQHKDVVKVMDEISKEKPWSRYMIQQHLDGGPAKKTVQDRLDELVELEVLDKYEYSNQTLYDLAYNPIITDGGSLKDANLIELATLRDRNSLRDLGTGAMLFSLLFLGLGILAELTMISGEFVLSGNIYFDTAIILYLAGWAILLPLLMLKKLEPWLPSPASQENSKG